MLWLFCGQALDGVGVGVVAFTDSGDGQPGVSVF